MLTQEEKEKVLKSEYWGRWNLGVICNGGIWKLDPYGTLLQLRGLKLRLNGREIEFPLTLSDDEAVVREETRRDIAELFGFSRDDYGFEAYVKALGTEGKKILRLVKK